MAMGEREFEDWVVKVAERNGWCGIHVRDSEGALRGVHRHDAFGWPDWVFWSASRQKFLLRELKTMRGQLSVFQRERIADLAAAGADVGVWRPSDEQLIRDTFGS